MYDYATEKPKVLTAEGQRDLFAADDAAMEMLEISGAVQAAKLLNVTIPGGGDSFYRMALVDRLVEMGRILEVPQKDGRPWQCRVFTANGAL